MFLMRCQMILALTFEITLASTCTDRGDSACSSQSYVSNI